MPADAAHEWYINVRALDAGAAGGAQLCLLIDQQGHRQQYSIDIPSGKLTQQILIVVSNDDL